MNAEAPPPRNKRSSLMERLKRLVAEYGVLAVFVFVAVSVIVFAGAYAAISLGWKPTSTAGTVGTAAAAYVAYRLTLVFRIAAAVLLTPLVARLLERLRLRRRPPPA
ncbi:MAG TPA: hypothetical protein VE782_01955 [Myxococcaceae bacterium]|nr:hypothetical protein [Myxococcaceae bacterium]